MVDELNIKEWKFNRLNTQESLLNHTRYFFKELYGRKFVVNSHHEAVCELLDRVIKGEVTKVMINIAPRYGKTEIAVKNFISHGLALNPASKYIHLSYSDDLALDNSEGVKAIVEHEAYQALFPEVQIKKDSKAKKKWYTTAGGGVYATSTAGQVTGFGAGHVDKEEDEEEFLSELDSLLNQIGINTGFGGALVIDDPIKPEDADSEDRRNRINARYDSTIKNRVNSRRTPIILMGQRTHDNDLCGYLLKNEPGEWTVLSLPCIQEDSNGGQYALWPFKHKLSELITLRTQNPVVFERQMQQNPTPAEGFLYDRPFKTYEVIPVTVKKPIRKNYTDTADEGSDFLCSIDYIETDTAMYVTDILFTQASMETTETQTAKMVWGDEVDVCRVESNNGGKGFQRNVEKQVRLLGNLRMRFVWFHQGENKYARIFTNSNTVLNLIHFPKDWEARWPKFAQQVKTYMAVGKNAHDDAPDTLTGMVEFFGKDKSERVFL
ncbi:phage terminase large subunit [Spirosoma foliorum]|uniref:Phage terminase large subunit n=1 Tax=Spirosoma foliorum TaxID=2710596 RepID=A0A7G5H2G7_9BACT|nr:phage terminase large subunit [Spirosoma foliorum]QMW05309.1 phage terminase large subunit [Spirosoma foliorum]